MSEHWTDRLSEYLDGELPVAEVTALEAHLETCSECAGTLVELRDVVGAARALTTADALAHAPAPDLWPRIAARLIPRTADGPATPVLPLENAGARRRHRIALTVPQLAAAALALVLFSASGVWLAIGGAPERPVAEAADPAGPAPVAFAASWDAALVDMEAEFERRRADLDPGTIQVVERNLAIIDQAIAEARRALEADPSSAFLHGYVADAVRRKADLLRQATRIQRTET